MVPGSSSDEGHCMALAMAWAMNIDPDPCYSKIRDKDMFLCGSMDPDISMVSGGCVGYACVLLPATLLFSVLSLFIVHKASCLSHSSTHFLIIVLPAPPSLHGCRPLWFWCLSPLHWDPGVDSWAKFYRLGISLHKGYLI